MNSWNSSSDKQVEGKRKLQIESKCSDAFLSPFSIKKKSYSNRDGDQFNCLLGQAGVTLSSTWNGVMMMMMIIKMINIIIIKCVDG